VQNREHILYSSHSSHASFNLREVAIAQSVSVAYLGILFGGGEVQQIQLRTEDRENGDLGLAAP